MAKKTDSELVTYDNDMILFDEASEVIDLSRVLDEAGYNSEKIPLRQLSLRPFVVRWMTSFRSTKYDDNLCYHVIARDYESGAIFQTTIGAKNVVEMLSRLEEKGYRSGIKLTIEYIEGGQFGGYYRLV